ncbi:MAG: four helix bundle protein [Lentisphaerae bacterium RIFOXYB12_FULL_65_16]|nr:MAG: four helix bundle protein [Lentisphaerae bacterium RIFOXYA12_64_32]OGV93948.1 MAG: four helix bundle protein [Lentisphaerae bacterium RIFOXYB12_FULL_65_16]
MRLLESAPEPAGLIPAHGDYRKLASYIVAEIVFDATLVFCERFVDPRSRTYDQMVQAARSGKQNIAEGSMVSGTSKKSELKLTGVARGSLEELLRDYEDYLRNHKLPLWGKTHPKAQAVRALARAENRSYGTYETYVKDGTPEVAANTIICLIHQANFLIDRQLKALDRAFLENGGFTERLYRMRTDYRQSKQRGTEA